MNISFVREKIELFYKQIGTIRLAQHNYREFYSACSILLQIDSYLSALEESDYGIDSEELIQCYNHVLNIVKKYDVK